MIESEGGRPDQFRSGTNNLGTRVEQPALGTRDEPIRTRRDQLKHRLAKVGGALLIPTTTTLVAVNSLRNMGLFDLYSSEPVWVPPDGDNREGVEVVSDAQTAIRNNPELKDKNWPWEQSETDKRAE